VSGSKSPECQHVNSRNCLLAILACRVSSGLKMADSATWSLREPRVVTKIDRKFSIHGCDVAGRNEYRISKQGISKEEGQPEFTSKFDIPCSIFCGSDTSVGWAPPTSA
jgi:hypothetical protein